MALVGAGPASIAAAAWLALDGHRAVIFEQKAVPGGLNTLGIAPYKMKGDDAARRDRLGARAQRAAASSCAPAWPSWRARRGPGQVSAADLLRDYDAVFLGLGLGADTRLGVPGEDGPGVVGATAFIERLKADPTLTLDGVKRALVVGGGNTALDALHELALLGVDTTMVYRRSQAEMPGYEHELEGARPTAGASSQNRVPVAVLRERDRVAGLRVAPASDGKAPDGPLEDIPADLVVVAIGQSRATRVALAFPGVALDAKGRLVVDPDTHRTRQPQGLQRRRLRERRQGGRQRGGRSQGRRARHARGLHGSVAMADLSIDFCGINSPNPFWLASAPPTNTGDQVMRAFDAGWGGAVWKTLGNPIVNVSSRFGGIDYGNTRLPASTTSSSSPTARWR